MQQGRQEIKHQVSMKSMNGQTKVITITEHKPTGKVKHVFKTEDENNMNLGDNIPPSLIKKL